MYTNTEGQAIQPNRFQGEQSSHLYYEGGNRGYNDYYRGRGCGRYSGGRTYNNEGRDASRITCFRCDKVGHFVAQFPKLLLKLQ